MANTSLCSWWQDITEEITQAKRSGGLKCGDSDLEFKHVSGFSFLGEENRSYYILSIVCKKVENSGTYLGRLKKKKIEQTPKM